MTVEEATRAELASLPPLARGSALAAAALVLARRLDAGPGDAVASMLVRELRHAMNDLRRRAGGDSNRDLDEFLASIAVPEFGDPPD
jgi:hypothetical protein